MSDKISQSALDQLFLKAHTQRVWQDKPVEESLLQAVYDLGKMVPTSANTNPMRILFIKTPASKVRLKDCLMPGNIEATMKAPVTAIIAQDMRFYDYLPRLFPQADAKSWFVGNEEEIKATAFRNSSLQKAYFMLAARALGLDCGPMSRFDQKKLDREFFPDGRFKSNFLCNLGYAEQDKAFPRNDQLTFKEACQII